MSRRTRLALFAAAATVVLAVVLGVALMERRGGVRDPSSTATPSLVIATPSASATATPPSPAATPIPSVTPVTPTPTPIALPAHAEIDAPDRDTVWALVEGMSLFVSADQGGTWQERSLPPPGIDFEVSFVSDREGWLMESPGTGCETHVVRLWHTSDGASTWEEIQLPALLMAQCKGSLSFVHSGSGFIAVWGASEGSATLHTTDGGRTWRRIPFPDPPGFDARGSRALIAGAVRAFGTAVFVDARAHGDQGMRRFVFVWNSNAPGWSYLDEVPNAQDAFVFAGGPGGGDLRWLLVSPGGTWQESTDSGQTWHPFETDYQQAAPEPPVITFADGQVGYATVRGAIQRTTDGGRRWEEIQTPGT